MCGGSANGKFFLPSLNGDLTLPSASEIPSANAIVFNRTEVLLAGAARATPWAVPPLTTSNLAWP